VKWHFETQLLFHSDPSLSHWQGTFDMASVVDLSVKVTKNEQQKKQQASLKIYLDDL
jgi:hypothetical protein